MKNRVYLYPSDVAEQTFFGTRGLGALEALSARVTEDLLAPFAYNAVVTIPIGDRLAERVITGAVLGIPCVDGMEPFRVTRTRKTLTTITAECWHITQDLRDGLIENRAWEGKQLSAVWEEILQAGGHTMFHGTSTIDRVESVRIVRRSVWEAIVGDQDNSVISRWGGEVSRSGWSVNIQDRRGQDRDWQIRYGHNLTGINDDVDVSDVIHAVLPTYTLSDTAVHTMEVQYCPGYSTLDRPRTVSIHYSNIAETESEAEQIIADRIQLMWTQKAHLPRASCVVEFLDLARVGVALPWSEDVRIGDRIRAVWVGHVDIDQRVVRTEWDALAQKWVRIVLGQPERSLVALTGLIDEQFGVVRNQLDGVLDGVLSSSIGATLLLNEAYANALGYYQTDRKNEATGAIITYIHDAPVLEESVWIATVPEPGTYLWTDQGWNNGDPVWTQGISNDGNMVMRMISTVGLNADWINSGQVNANLVDFDGAKGNNVELSGKITATSGKIGGYDISGNNLVGNDVILEPSKIKIGSSAIEGLGATAIAFKTAFLYVGNRGGVLGSGATIQWNTDYDSSVLAQSLGGSTTVYADSFVNTSYSGDYVNLTLINGWTGTLKVGRHGNDLVHIYGEITPGVTNRGTTIATLTPNYRPGSVLALPAQSAGLNVGAINGLAVVASGNINIYGSASEDIGEFNVRINYIYRL